MHPFLRLTPPRALRNFEPQHILPGHGRALHENAREALRAALASSRRDAPRTTLAMVRAFALRPR